MTNLRSTLVRNGDLIALALIPFLFLAVNPAWFSNLYGDVDTWIYHGYFYDVLHKDRSVIPLVFDYSRTRLAYILPGALPYAVFPAGAARVVFNLLMIYPAIVGSFWYVVRSHTSRPVAFAGAAMLAADIYSLRMFGWQYVDNGVVAYEALTFAFLTAATRSNHPARWQVAAGFAAGCMIFTHLGAGIMLPVFAVYAVLPMQGSPWAKQLAGMVRLALHAAFGALAAFVVLSTLNALIYHQSFLFMIFQQLKITSKETERAVSKYNQPIAFLRDRGFWLAMPGAAMLASFAALTAGWRGWFRPFRLTFEIFCLLTAAVLPLTVLLLEITQKAFLLSREGEYVSFFFVPVYLGVTVLLFRPGVTGWRTAIYAAVLSIMATAIRLSLTDGLGLAAWLPLPMYALAILLAVPLAVAATRGGGRATVVCLGVLAVLTLLVPCRFVHDPAVGAAEQAIRRFSGDETPRFYFNRDDPVNRDFFISLIASFGERALWEHGEDFSTGFAPLLDSKALPAPGDLLVILSSTQPDRDAVARSVEAAFKAIRPLEPVRIDHSGSSVWVYGFFVRGQAD